MSYIGRGISNLSDRAVLDSITASATATYNLLLNSVAYVPSSAESLTVSLNGVIQAPTSSYTVSGSTIIFASNLASSDVIDFILAERAITLTTIGSGTVTTSNIVDSNVTTAKIADNAVTSAKLASGLAFGKIGQVLQQEYATAVQSSSTSYADNGQTLAITPSATSSKILVMVETQVKVYGGNADSNYGGRWKIVRTPSGGSAADAFINPDEMVRVFNGYTGASFLHTRMNITHLDSPSTTSSVVYKVQQRAVQSNIVITSQIGSGKSKLTLMEVLA